jgi:predicted glycosyltransferase involved in capsule biosynthesis
MNKHDLLMSAIRVTNNRSGDYGDVYTNHERIAVLWTVIFGREVKAHQVAMAMAAVKLARLVETPDHQDSWIDLAGYAAIGSECIDGEQEANDG